MKTRLRNGHRPEKVLEFGVVGLVDVELRRSEVLVYETGMHYGMFPEAARTPLGGWRCLWRGPAANGCHGRTCRRPPRAPKGAQGH